MKIFAISDLHLPGQDNKPMDIFGPHWEGHFEKIKKDWIAKVSPEDVVLIAGDISWAMTLDEAAGDLREIGALPGTKIILRGNHDYWWSSVTRVRDLLPPGMYAIQNDSLKIGETVFCGTRLWNMEGTPEDTKIYRRELMRLDMSLKNAAARGGNRIIVMTHYPPLTENGGMTDAGRIIEQYPVTDVIYGHLHGKQTRAFNDTVNGIRYLCTSCDKLSFELASIAP